MLTSNGRNIVLLSYNCVGPESCWATEVRPGCAYVKINAVDGGPSRPQAELRDIDPGSLAEMENDIANAGTRADLVIVALHKGITHVPARLAAYERPLSQAAARAGAHVVVGHHAHIAQGIEIFEGTPIFHGLGNGCVVTNALSPDENHPARAEWIARRKRLFGFEPLPDYPLAPFHPEARNGLIARLLWHPDGRIEPGFIPIWFEPPGRPVIGGRHANSVVRYIRQITTASGLPPLQLTEHAGEIAVQAI